MKIARFTVNPIQENTYILWDDTLQCVIVDAGCACVKEESAIVDFIAQHNLTPTMLLNTHGHFDHTMGVEHMRNRFSIPFAMHSADEYLLQVGVKSGAMFGIAVEAMPESIDCDLKELPQVKFGNTVLQVLHTPGHTPGGVCFFNAEDKILLTGDTLFRESIGRTDLPGGDYSALMQSLLTKIVVLGDEVKVYPGHEQSTDIGHEVLYNPFITEVINKEVNYK